MKGCAEATDFFGAVSRRAFRSGRRRRLGDGHLYVHKTGRCGVAREVLASFYGTGKLTANGERFHPFGLTAASYDYVLGTTITVKNPHNGRTCQVRVNDHGPNGLARIMGARIDFALGARDCLGMVASQYVCAPHAHSFAHLHVKKRHHHVCVQAAFEAAAQKPSADFGSERETSSGDALVNAVGWP